MTWSNHSAATNPAIASLFRPDGQLRRLVDRNRSTLYENVKRIVLVRSCGFQCDGRAI